MSLIKKIISSISILCAVGCSNNDEQQRQELLKWLDHHISHISEQLASDIEKERQGFYPHDGKTEYHSKGYIDYVLREKNGNRLEVSQHSLLTIDDIKHTAGYQRLSAAASKLQASITISNETIDGDEVESYEELDEYIDDIQQYFVIRVSGWPAAGTAETYSK